MADPVALVRARRQEVAALRTRATARIEARLHRAADQTEHLRRQVVALSPQSTLERGYAVVQHRDGRIVMDQDDVGVGELLRVRVARGDFGVRPVSDGADETSERGAPRTRSAGDGTSAARKTARATTRATTSRRTAATRSATEAVVKEGVKQAARKPTAKQVGRPARKTTGSAPAGSAEALPLDPQESPGGDGGDVGDVTRRS